MKNRKVILRAIAQHIEQHGYPPTLDELRSTLGLSADELQAETRQLQRDGYIIRMPATERWLYLTRRGWSLLNEQNDYPRGALV